MSIKNISCIAAFVILSACGKSKTDQADTPLLTPESMSTQVECNSEENPGIDCGCINNLVENSWSDDAETDMSTVLAKSGGELSQQSIDVIIDIALMADDECVVD